MNATAMTSEPSTHSLTPASRGWTAWHSSLTFAVAALTTAGLWALGGVYLGHAGNPLATAAAGLLLALAAVTAYTDLTAKRIPNWATYTTFVLALTLNLISVAANPPWLGAVGLGPSLVGGFGLFFAMLVVFSITGGGAGDVKFAGCLGALFGVRTGLDALITGYVVGAAVMGAIAIVKYGPVKLFMLAFRSVGSRLAPQWIHGPAPSDRKLMMTQVPLGPFFATGAFVSLYRTMVFDGGLFF